MRFSIYDRHSVSWFFLASDEKRGILLDVVVYSTARFIVVDP